MIVSTALLVGLAALPLHASPTSWAIATTDCNGQKYVYNRLAGYGFTPSDARDKFKDTAGGIGSWAALDITTWQKEGNTYTGILYALPDRGWNTEGTLNYQPRYHKFHITFTPNASASAADPSPPNLKREYLDSIRFSGPNDFTGPYLTQGITELPSSHYEQDGFGGNGTGGDRPDLDSEGMVLNGDGSFWISDECGAYIYLFTREGKLI